MPHPISIKGEVIVLAKGRGIIYIDKFREMFDLPEDAEIMNLKYENGAIVFEMVSAEEVKGKFIKGVEFSQLRRVRLVDRYEKLIASKLIENDSKSIQVIARVKNEKLQTGEGTGRP